jgi:hypothetical protein
LNSGCLCFSKRRSHKKNHEHWLLNGDNYSSEQSVNCSDNLLRSLSDPLVSSNWKNSWFNNRTAIMYI